VLAVLDARFWFIGILEELDLSISVFCALGNHCGGGSKISLTSKGRNGGRSRRLMASGETFDKLKLPIDNGVYNDDIDDAYDEILERDNQFSREDDDMQDFDNHKTSLRAEGASEDDSNENPQRPGVQRRRSLLQKHSSKPVGFRLDGTTRDEVGTQSGTVEILEVYLLCFCKYLVLLLSVLTFVPSLQLWRSFLILQVAAANALDVKLYSLIRQRLHTAAAKHAPTEFARLKGTKK